ncbi:MAG: hypothetical protein IT435_01660 [Phycisphaerales bacterium]|nr:hypothetical protein [Phycisphaerales bacterium]
MTGSSWQQMLGLESPEEFRDRVLARQRASQLAFERRCLGISDLTGAAPRTSCWRVVLGVRGGETVMYEYARDGGLRDATTYPTSGRGYYRRGDVILVAEVTQRNAELMFPELRQEEDSSSALATIALGLLGSSPPGYTVGWRIVAIEPRSGSGGEGRVTTRGVVIFGEDCIELEHQTNWSRQQMHDSFVMSEAARSMSAMLPLLEALANVMIDVATMSVGRAVARGVGRRVALYSLRAAWRATARRMLLRRALRLAISRGGRLTAGAIAAFVQGVVREIADRSQANELRRRAGAGLLEMQDIRPHVAAGVQSLASYLLGAAADSLGSTIRRDMRNFTDEGVRRIIATKLTQTIVQACTTIPFATISDAAAAAYRESLSDPGSFSRRFGQMLADFHWQLIQRTLGTLSPSAIAEIAEEN